MSDTKTVLEQIKDEYAREKNWDSFDEMTAIYIGVHGVKKGAEIISNATDEISRRYATACCKATQERCAENSKMIYHDGVTKENHEKKWFQSGADHLVVSKASITDPKNIVLL